MNQESLRQLLLRLDQRSYKAYQELGDRYLFPGFRLQIDRVQGDPFAAPSQCRVIVPQMLAGFPPETYGSRTREIALRDFLARGFDRALRSHSRCRGSGNSGRIAIAAPGQTILESTAVLINATQLEVRFVVGLPAEGRRIAGAEAIALFCEDLPQVVAQSLSYSALDPQALQQHLETAEDADWLRQQLPLHGLVAFVADGAILPRRSGVDQRPLEADVIPFSAPASLRLELTCPNRGRITGMGIPPGDYPNCGRRLPRQINAVAGPGTGRLQPSAGGWARSGRYRCGGGKNSGGAGTQDCRGGYFPPDPGAAPGPIHQ